MRIPGVSFWALVTALILYFLLSATGTSTELTIIVSVLWYIIGAGAAFAVMRFHHPIYEDEFVPSEGGLQVTPPAGYYAVTFSNQARTVYVRRGGNLRKAAANQGVQVYYDINKYANCFGLGHCGTCRFSPDPKNPQAFSEPTWQERFTLGDDAGKVRLACQTRVFGNATVDNVVAEEFGKVRHYAVVNGALLGAFSIIMLAIIVWMGGDMIGLF